MFKLSNLTQTFKHNPFAVSAYFRRSLVLAYACPPETLEPLLPPGLTLDTWSGYGFVALALVQTERLRPGFLPAALGRDFFLCGYRIFVRRGANRGLHILRSLTDKPAMVRFGNFFTHYHYGLCRAEIARHPAGVLWDVRMPDGEPVLEVIERESPAPSPLPGGSPFQTLHDARRFAGPLPITFGYDPESHSLISVRGVRSRWDPRPVEIEIRHNNIVPSGAVLANAFALADVPYRWLRGVRIALEAA